MFSTPLLPSVPAELKVLAGLLAAILQFMTTSLTAQNSNRRKACAENE